MPVVKASSKGQIVIPKEFREKLGIGAGKRLLLRLAGNHMEIFPLPDEPVNSRLCGHDRWKRVTYLWVAGPRSIKT